MEKNKVGGVVGENSGSTKVQYCYNSGAVGGTSIVGGIIGESKGSSFAYDIRYEQQCYSTGTVSATNYVGGDYGYYGTGNETRYIEEIYYLEGTAENGVNDGDIMSEKGG